MSQWLPRWNQVAKVTPGIVKKAQEILTKHPKAGVFSLLPKDMFLCMVFDVFSCIFLAFFTVLFHFVLSRISESMGHEMWPISMDGITECQGPSHFDGMHGITALLWCCAPRLWHPCLWCHHSLWLLHCQSYRAPDDEGVRCVKWQCFRKIWDFWILFEVAAVCGLATVIHLPVFLLAPGCSLGARRPWWFLGCRSKEPARQKGAFRNAVDTCWHLVILTQATLRSFSRSGNALRSVMQFGLRTAPKGRSEPRPVKFIAIQRVICHMYSQYLLGGSWIPKKKQLSQLSGAWGSTSLVHAITPTLYHNDSIKSFVISSKCK